MELYKQERYRDCNIKVYYDPDPESPRTWDNIATFVCEHGHYQLGDEQDAEAVVNRLFDDYSTTDNIIKYFVKTRHCKFHTACEEDRENGYAGFYEWTEYVRPEYQRYDSGKRSLGLETCKDKYDILAYRIVDEELGTGDKLQVVIDSGNIAILPISMYEHSGITMWLGSTDGHMDAQWDCSNLGFAYIEREKALEQMPHYTFPDKNFGDDWKAWAYAVMESEMKTYDEYLRGEVYGFIVEDEYGDHLDSCWGYFGDEMVDDIFKEAKSEIDSHFIEKMAKSKEYAHLIFDNLASLQGKKFVISNYAYRVGKNLFGMDILERAKISDNVVGAYDEVSPKDIEYLDLETLAKHADSVAAVA